MQIDVLKDDSEKEIARKYAKLVTSPELAAYRVKIGGDGVTSIYADVDTPTLVDELRVQAAAINRGETVDSKATGKAIGKDQAMATVG